MKILLVSLHVNQSPQALPLAAGNLKAALPVALQPQTQLINFDLNQPFAEVFTQICAAQADLVAFSMYLWNRQSIVQLAAALKKSTNAPFIVVGGPEAGADADRLLASNCFDALVCGEGEMVFAQLVCQLAAGQKPGPMEGIAYAHQPRCSPGKPLKVETLASPWLQGCLAPVAGGVLWEVARGCPFACSFCYDAKGVAGVRSLPTARLKAELDLFNQADVSQVWVLDSTFNAPAKRGHQLLQLLLERAPLLHYHLEAKGEFIDQKTVGLLQQLSCSVQLGLQSADHEVLAGLNRAIDPQRFWRGVALLANSGVTFGFDLIYGLPGDSPQGFFASLERAMPYRPNQIDIFPLAVLPGTQLARQRHDLGLKADEQPPYLLRESPDFSRAQIHDCALLAAAFDLFYNRGRAVGFLLPFCTALRLSPLRFIQNFKEWFCQIHASEEKLLNNAAVDSGEIFLLQQAFMDWQLTQLKRQKWRELAQDILRYHFYYAEILLSDEPTPQQGRCPVDPGLHRASGVHLVDFQYDLVEALETREIDLPRWVRILEKSPTRVLLFRRGRQVFCEAISDEFASVLNRPGLTPGKPRPAELAELRDFAWQQGLLTI